MRSMTFLAASVALLSSVLSQPAQARDRAEGWRNWTERATRIEAALLTGESPRLDSACKGVTGTVVGQGFQFPYWGQSLIQVCTVTQAALHGSDNRKRSKQICKDMTRVSGLLGKAEEVPEGPGAADVAKRLSVEIMEIRDHICSEVDGKKRR